MKIDMWYGDKFEDVTSADCFFYPHDCEYRGNLYIGDKCVGDYSSKDSVEVEEQLHIKFK